MVDAFMRAAGERQWSINGYRTTDAEPGTNTAIIEKRDSGSAVLLAIVLLSKVEVGVWHLFMMAPQQSAKDQAITGAQSISKIADKVGDAVGLIDV